MTELHAELAALKAELERPSAPRPEPTAGPGAGKELETMLADLGEALAEAGDETREAIATHPLAAVAAAFVLGIVVGRMTGRA